MAKPSEWCSRVFLHNTQEIRIKISADAAANANLQLNAGPSNGEPSSVAQNADGSVTHVFTAWVTDDDVKKYGSLVTAPITYEIAAFVGMAIAQCSLMEHKVRSLVTQLTKHNGTTLDWKYLGKFGAVVTRLQDEAKLISKEAPTGSRLLQNAAENTRKLHRSRGNMAHGQTALSAQNDDFYLVVTGRHGAEWFTEKSLRDLSLRMCRVSFELIDALDPDSRDVQRASRETHFLRDFQANNPRPDPILPKRPHQPRSSKR